MLSPQSVASQNVLDEVGFALARKKRIVPVLFKDCDIPFRLARLQYVDARTDYDGALRELLTALRSGETGATIEPSPSIPADSSGLDRRAVVAAAIVLALGVVGAVAWNRSRPSPSAGPVVTVDAPAAPSPNTPTPESGPAALPFPEAFARALQQYVSAAPGGFQAVGAKEFVDWTPSVVLPGAQTCRGSGYPHDPVVECVVYRTDSEVQAADKFEDLIALVQKALPAFTGNRVNAFRAAFSGAGTTPVVALGVTASGDHYDVELSVRRRSP